VDINLDTYGVAVDRITDDLARRARAVIVAHLFGQAAPIDQLKSFVSRFDVALIEDAALALGSRIGKEAVGSFGDVACLSFHPRKMITTGEGGMVLTDSETAAHRVEELRAYGASVSAWDRHRHGLFSVGTYESVGYNYKLSDILAGIGIEQLNKLPTIIELRQQIAARYRASLADVQWIRLPTESAQTTHVYQSFVCLLEAEGAQTDALTGERNRLLRHLLEHGIESVQGAQAMSTVGYYRDKYGWRPGDYPSALLADSATFALPIYPGLTEEQQSRVIEAIRSFQPMTVLLR
jgi:perosamine synthetase